MRLYRSQPGLLNEAIKALKQSIVKGYTNFDHMRQDTDFTILRELPEFNALIPSAESNPQPSEAP